MTKPTRGSVAGALANKPHPVDEVVGRRIRLRRKERGLSQAYLAERLGLTFQQVQKYERGSNRISASKLWQVARVLDVPVSSLFPGYEEASTGASRLGVNIAVEELMADTHGRVVAEAFPAIRQPRIRRALVNLLRDLSRDDFDID